MKEFRKPKYDFSGRTVVVTGAASGIGYATAERMLADGANVVMVDYNRAELERAGEALNAPGRVLLSSADVGSEAAVQDFVESALQRFGAIDFAFNNAGVAGPHRRIDQFSVSDYATIMDTNVRGTWLCMRAQLAHMIPRGSGVIVNTSSAIGLVGGPAQSIYTASKHAVVGLTKSAALDVKGTGIRINCVNPGVVATPLVEEAVRNENPEILEIWHSLHPVGRIGTPDDIAGLAAWLFSDDASFVHGAAISIDGGYTTA